MPNSYSGIFNTLAASFNRASLAKGGKNALITAVTRDFSPEVAAPFQVINTNIMGSTGSATSFTPGTTTLTLSDVTIGPGAVTLNQFPTYGVLLPSGDISRSSSSFVDKIRDECIKKIGDSINGTLAGLITTGNFDSYSVVASGEDTVADTAITEAWFNLANNDIPVGDLGDVFLITHPKVYSNLLDNQKWTQAQFIGDQLADKVRQTAMLGTQWGAFCDWDPDMPTTTGGTTTPTRYYSMLMHRHAIALVTRALARPLDTGVPTAYFDYKGISIRATIAWNNLKRADELVMDAMFGVAVVRKDHGCLMLST